MEKVSRSYSFPISNKPTLPEDKAEASQTKTTAPQLISRADLGILTLPFRNADKIQKKAVNKMPPKKRSAIFRDLKFFFFFPVRPAEGAAATLSSNFSTLFEFSLIVFIFISVSF